MNWIESIRIEHGTLHLMDYHIRRIKDTLSKAGATPTFQLHELLKAVRIPSEGRYKFRLVYGTDKYHFTITPYLPREVRSLKVVDGNSIHYGTKREDRSEIDTLFTLRNGSDDIIIIKNGFVTDSSYSNVVFRKSATWFTPEQPLLHGVMRQYLIDNRQIEPREILLKDIRSYEGCKLINAMIGFEMPEIEISKIVI